MVASSSTESKNKETNLENNLSESRIEYSKTKNKDKQIKNLEKLMKQAAEELNFLDAAKYRDEIKRLKENK